jgi:hypothetical protein
MQFFFCFLSKWVIYYIVSPFSYTALKIICRRGDKYSAFMEIYHNIFSSFSHDWISVKGL